MPNPSYPIHPFGFVIAGASIWNIPKAPGFDFMTQLKRSGYFDKIEIQEAKEDDVVKSVTTYGFTMTASVAQTPTTQTPQAQTKPAATATPPPAPAAKGRS